MEHQCYQANMEARQTELISGGHSELPQFKHTCLTNSRLHVDQLGVAPLPVTVGNKGL